MPDLRQNPPSKPAVVKKIAESQEEALRLIQEAKLSDARTMHAIQRIKQLAVSAFIELDELYRTFEALQIEPGRSAVHQQWANERIASILTQTERAMGEVVSAALRQIGAEVATPKPRAPAPKVILERVDPDWLKFGRKHQDGLYLLGLLIFGILTALVSGLLWLGIVLPILWVACFHEASVLWTVLIPIGLLLLLGVFV
jgi:hypothetical protein